jgi:biopolymer transport protein ExbD
MTTQAIRSSGNGEFETLMEVNTTPLIDVMLVLLVMLIITIPMQLHAINLDLPLGNAPPQNREPVVHNVAIDFDGTVYWDNQALVDQAAVDAKMQEIGALPMADQPELHIRTNKLVDYGVFTAVMASMQRHHVVKPTLVGTEQFAS